METIRKNRPYLAPAALLLALVLFFTALAPTAQAVGNVYEDEKNGTTFSFPVSWTPYEDEDYTEFDLMLSYRSGLKDSAYINYYSLNGWGMLTEEKQKELTVEEYDAVFTKEVIASLLEWDEQDITEQDISGKHYFVCYTNWQEYDIYRKTYIHVENGWLYHFTSYSGSGSSYFAELAIKDILGGIKYGGTEAPHTAGTDNHPQETNNLGGIFNNKGKTNPEENGAALKVRDGRGGNWTTAVLILLLVVLAVVVVVVVLIVLKDKKEALRSGETAPAAAPQPEWSEPVFERAWPVVPEEEPAAPAEEAIPAAPSEEDAPTVSVEEDAPAAPAVEDAPVVPVEEDVPAAPVEEARPAPRFCHSCGAHLEPDSRFCHSCGTKVAR